MNNFIQFKTKKTVIRIGFLIPDFKIFGYCYFLNGAIRTLGYIRQIRIFYFTISWMDKIHYKNK